MDQEGTDGEKLLKELRKRFGENVVPFVDIMTESDCPGGKVYLHTKESAVEEVLEELAVCEDDMMEEYLEEEESLWIKYKKRLQTARCFHVILVRHYILKVWKNFWMDLIGI